MTYRTIRITAPDGWTLKYDQEEAHPGKRDWVNNLNRPEFRRKGVFARDCDNFESVHRIEIKENYNGGGPDAFGGAKSWPVVESHVSFKENEHELAVQFAKGLAAFIHGFLLNRGR